MFYVGKVEQIVLGKVRRVCACCGLSLKHCPCLHDQEYVDTKCIYFHSTFRLLESEVNKDAAHSLRDYRAVLPADVRLLPLRAVSNRPALPALAFDYQVSN